MWSTCCSKRVILRTGSIYVLFRSTLQVNIIEFSENFVVDSYTAGIGSPFLHFAHHIVVDLDWYAGFVELVLFKSTTGYFDHIIPIETLGVDETKVAGMRTKVLLDGRLSRVFLVVGRTGILSIDGADAQE